MNAVSPFSFADLQGQGRDNPVAGAARGVAKGLGGAADVANAFADVWGGLDINNDGKLTGADLAGHAIAAGKEVLGEVFGKNDTAQGGASASSAAQAGAETAARSAMNGGADLAALGHRLYTASGAALSTSAIEPRASNLAARALTGAYAEMRSAAQAAGARLG